MKNAKHDGGLLPLDLKKLAASYLTPDIIAAAQLRRVQFDGPLIAHDLAQSQASQVAAFLTGVLAE